MNWDDVDFTLGVQEEAGAADVDVLPREGGLWVRVESWIGGFMSLLIALAVLFVGAACLVERIMGGLIDGYFALTVIMMPIVIAFDGYFIVTVFGCWFAHEFPLALHVPGRMWRFIRRTWPIGVLWWALHFLSVLMLLAAQRPMSDDSGGIMIDALMLFGFSYASNIYLMMTAGCVVKSRARLQAVWRYRLLIDLAVALTALAIHHEMMG